jgi:hypothetical protein
LLTAQRLGVGVSASGARAGRAAGADTGRLMRRPHGLTPLDAGLCIPVDKMRPLRQSGGVEWWSRAERAEIVALSIYLGAAERGEPVTRAVVARRREQLDSHRSSCRCGHCGGRGESEAPQRFSDRLGLAAVGGRGPRPDGPLRASRHLCVRFARKTARLSVAHGHPRGTGGRDALRADRHCRDVGQIRPLQGRSGAPSSVSGL